MMIWEPVTVVRCGIRGDPRSYDFHCRSCGVYHLVPTEGLDSFDCYNYRYIPIFLGQWQMLVYRKVDED